MVASVRQLARRGKQIEVCILVLAALMLFGVQVHGEDAIDTARLSSSIVTLQPVYDGAREEYLLTLRNSLSRRGYRVAADLLEDYMGGGFLNGVVVRWGERYYVLTSRHGVALARRVVVERAGGRERIGSCEVVYAGGGSDLAVVALPPHYAGSALQLDTLFSDWGSGLVVAGYEGLGGEPQWVVESGHRALRAKGGGKSRKEGPRGKEDRYVEYDASFDPGMTGSALLAGDARGNGELRLVGINIWKGTLQPGRSIAVQALEAVRALRDLERGRSVNAFKGMALAHAIQQGGDTLAAKLGDDYLVSIPVDRVFVEYDEMPSDARRAVSRLLRAGESVEGVRLILASVLQRGYSDACIRMEGDVDRYELVARGDRVPVEVVREHGDWRVDELALPPRAERTSYGLARSVALRGTVRFGMGFPWYSGEGKSVSLGFSYMHWTYFFFQVWGGYGQYGFEVVDPFTGHKQSVAGSYLGIAPSLGVQLPIRADAVLVLPYARGFYGMHYSLRTTQENFQFFRSYRAVPGFSVGVDVAYKVRDGFYLVGGVGGQCVLIASNFGSGEVRGFGLEISLGIGF